MPAPTTAAPPAVLSAVDLGKRYGERWALRHASFEIHSGERIAVIGPNGAGKTTLLSMLAGIIPATEGQVVGDERGAGWVPQQAAIYSKLSVAENLRLFARLEKVSDPGAAVDRMLDQTDLRDRADDEVSELSGGNQQRVNIAIGLLSDPPVLLADEPSTALDPRQRERLWEFVGGLSERGTGVVYSTHNVAEAERYGDRVLVIADGELLFTGSPRELQETVGGDAHDFEGAFVRFLHDKGH